MCDKLDTFFVPYSDVIVSDVVPPKRFSWLLILLTVLFVVVAWMYFQKKNEAPKKEEPTVTASKVYPSQPLERLGVKLKDVMLEEGVPPNIIANTVAFLVRTMLHASTPVESSTPVKQDARRIISDLPHTKPKRKPTVLEPIVEEDKSKEKQESPRLKKLLEDRERMEEEMRSKGALDPKDPLKP